MIKAFFPNRMSDLFPDRYIHIDIMEGGDTMEDSKFLQTLSMEPCMVNGEWETSDVVGFLEMHGWDSLSEPTLHDELMWSMEVERVM